MATIGILFGLLLAPPQAPASRWTTASSVSPMDDSRTVTLTNRALRSIQAWPRKTLRPSLILRCKEGQIGAYVAIGASPDVDEQPDTAEALVRFDQEPAFTLRMGESTSHDSLFFPDAKHVIRRMAAQRTLTLRFTPFNSTPQETAFDLGGLSEKLAALRAACSWKTEADLTALDREQFDQQVETLLHGALTAQRAMAAHNLAKMDGFEKQAVTVLVKALDEKEPIVRNAAVVALGSMGFGAREAVPALEALVFASDDATTLSLAQRSLTKIKQ